MQSVNDIRAAFLDYFGSNGHEVVSSSPLVPRNDPTLLFTNAGMVQFKNVFVGAETRDYVRAATAQKCVRAGGKHNDLENVGYTARHHTFFEMLGNFSFGDYFKDQAIELAWNLITKELGLAVERLTVTVYHDDDEAFGLWRKIAGLPESKIIRIPTSDNFWSMGDTGPCGPCSEIFYDHGVHIPGGPPGSPEADGDRFIEIWNLVFMQFEQHKDGSRTALPKPSIDTGMGLERISAVLQGTHDNYETDLFQALIHASAEAARVSPTGEHAVSHRVIADHLRASSFLITDGVLPSNEGRGYVLRRIMRRAMRHAHMMGCTEPLMHKLVGALVKEMGLAYPELARSAPLISETLELEETRFKRTLERGLGLLADETAQLPNGGVLKGEIAFKLYDTFGFPLDLTQDALRGQGFSVDLDGFEREMARQREDARRAWAGSGEAATEQVWFDIRTQHGATEFLGYDADEAAGRVVAIVVDGKQVDEAKPGAEAAILVNQTPFYAESGGQQGDHGSLWTDAGGMLMVSDTQKKLAALHVHMGRISKGTIRVGDEVQMSVNGERRASLRGHHSATHLLHAALRRRLGEHVAQKGSLVAADRLRFDISHPKPIGPEDLAFIESEVNKQVRANSEVVTRLMTPEEAIETGAMALFGEKYGDEVRVLSMGEDGNKPYSVELCGGTHVRRTGDIGLFKLVGESAVGAGVRRIEAVTGAAAEAYVTSAEQTLQAAAALLRVGSSDLAARIEGLLDERRKLERELQDARRAIATGGGGASEVKSVNGVNFIGKVLDGVPAKDLKSLADDLKTKVGSGVVVLIGVSEGKGSIVVGVTDDHIKSHSAVELVRIGSIALGGKGGGGRPDMAQAGGPDGARAADALAAIEDALNAAKAAE